MPTKRDFYEVLGVAKTATAAEIKSAYRKMALKFHPDRNKEPDAETKFKEINEAYQILSDTQKRQAYDQFGHAAFDPASGMGGMGGNPFGGGAYRSGPFTWSYSSSGGAGGAGQNPFGDFDFNDPFEIFESFFGGSANRRPRYSLTIDFMDAVKGAEKKVTVEGKQRTIKIPPGANDGTRLRFDDFDITLDVRPDKTFRREGYDLFVDQEISFTTAALGGEVEVTTVDAMLKMKVRAGTQSHTLVRLRGEGVPHLQSRGKGDLYVRLMVKVPEKLSREQKNLLEKLREVEE